MHTLGDWTVTIKREYLHEPAISIPIHTSEGQMLLSCNGLPKCGEMLDNALLIVSAVNACQKINPDSPLKVADSMFQVYEVLKGIVDFLKQAGYGTKAVEEVLARIVEVSKESEDRN